MKTILLRIEADTGETDDAIKKWFTGSGSMVEWPEIQSIKVEIINVPEDYTAKVNKIMEQWREIK